MRSPTPSSPTNSDSTSAGKPQPPELKPVIADLLRTRNCIQPSVLLVEALDFAPTGSPPDPDDGHRAEASSSPPTATATAETRWRALRLVLGDGDLAIQALLHPDLHRLADGGTVRVGALVAVTRFEARWRKRPTTAAGTGGDEMVYLVVSRLDVVGYDEEFAAEALAAHLEETEEEELAEELDEEAEVDADSPVDQEVDVQSDVGDDQDGQTDGTELREKIPTVPTRSPPPTTGKRPRDDLSDLEDLISSDDDFETTTTDTQRAAQQREAASRLEAAYLAQTQKLPWRATLADPTRPVRLTPLRGIPHLPYAQNWTVNVLAVVASLSAVEPASLWGYATQRVARLADPTTAKRVHLTVFLDPEAFCPAVGSVVLLTGVKNHRFEGGSLKRYRDGGGGGGGKGGESSKGREQGAWWLENPVGLEWCDAAALREWWAGRAGVA